jgi:hypothetical protein
MEEMPSLSEAVYFAAMPYEMNNQAVLRSVKAVYGSIVADL